MRYVMVMSFTASIGVMAIFAVDLVDMIFIAMLGNDALAAAIGYAGTLLFFTTSVSIGLSIAAGALSARAIGSGNATQARKAATTVSMLGVIVSLLVAGLVWWQMRTLLGLLGASGKVQDLAVSCLSIILPTMPVMMAAMVASAVLRSHGDARRATTATLVADFVDTVFDMTAALGANLESGVISNDGQHGEIAFDGSATLFVQQDVNVNTI
jgi:Na+-driven multidrug efflux pump